MKNGGANPVERGAMKRGLWIQGVLCVVFASAGLALAFAGVMPWGVLAQRLGALAAWTAFAVLVVWTSLRRVSERGRVAEGAIVSIVVMCTLYISGWLVLRGTPFGGGLPNPLFASSLVGGMALIGMGVVRRVGDTLHCPGCEYEYAPPEAGEAGPERCPECGARWQGKLKKGRRARSARLVTAGILVAVLGMLVSSPVFYLGRLSPYLPTGVLMRALMVSPRSTLAGWEELGSRSLSEGQRRWMYERVLEERVGMFPDTRPTRWMEGQIQKGVVPADVLERFYSEGFRGRLEAPARARVGEPFRVAMRVERMAPDAAINIGVLFHGYTVGHDSAPVGQEQKTRWGYELRPRDLAGSRRVFEHEIRVDQPGRVRVRMVYWVAYQPGFFDQLSWKPDGTPGSPPNVMWLRPFEDEREVEVMP